jgi:type III secretion protein N (ATPase)
MAKYAEIEFLLQVGEYKPGADQQADKAIAARAEIDALLRQDADVAEPFATSLMLLQGAGA